MTTQFTDLLRWQDRTFAVVGVDGDGLPDASAFGLQVEPTSTANWRGCVQELVIANTMKLIVDSLRQVGLSEGQRSQPPAVAGVSPVPDSLDGVKYVGVHLDVSFTGRLLVAANPVRGLPFRHMGFPPAWRFSEAWTLAFEEGRLLHAANISSEVEQLRDSILAGETPDPSGDPTDNDWINRQFGLDFDRSLGDSA